MNAFDAPRIDALARALDLSPRQLLVLAMQLARADGGDHANASTQRRQALADVRAAPSVVENVAALLATPIASFAQDDIDRALENLWPAVRCAED